MVKINFVGDVALFKEYEIKQCDPFKVVKLPESDFSVANFEFPIPSQHYASKKYFDVEDDYRISAEYCRLLSLNKFNLYSLANNHVQDYGEDGIKQTIEKIISAGALYFGVGTDSFNTVVQEIKGITFLFIAFVKKGRWDRKEGKIGPDPYEMSTLIPLISASKEIYDHIIIFPHWGTELVDAPDPADVVNARKMIDAGASCVIGHHPHVAQGCEIYKDGLIAYSLGSFIYLPDLEKGNTDRSPKRDISICLNIEFAKNSIVKHTPYKYRLNREKLIPICEKNYSSEKQYESLCSYIGDGYYYSKEIRKMLLRREFLSFVSRFKINPIRTTFYYLSYIKLSHIKKIIGLN